MIELVAETHSISTDDEAEIATGWLPGELSPRGRAPARELGERRLREANHGDLSGGPAEAVARERARRADAVSRNGESYREAVARLASFLADLLAGRGERVLPIAHSPLRFGLERRLHGTPLEGLVEAPCARQPGWEHAPTRERAEAVTPPSHAER